MQVVWRLVGTRPLHQNPSLVPDLTSCFPNTDNLQGQGMQLWFVLVWGGESLQLPTIIVVRLALDHNCWNDVSSSYPDICQAVKWVLMHKCQQLPRHALGGTLDRMCRGFELWSWSQGRLLQPTPTLTVANGFTLNTVMCKTQYSPFI